MPQEMFLFKQLYSAAYQRRAPYSIVALATQGAFIIVRFIAIDWLRIYELVIQDIYETKIESIV